MGNRTPESPRSTSQKLNKDRRIFVWCSGVLIASGLFLSGCGSEYTYPANSVPKSIEDINRKGYKIESTARVVGKTVGVVLYFDSILDAKGQISKEVHEAMGQAMQSVTRVALSTDLPLDFCSVVIRDRKNDNELVITRSVDDTRRAMADALGIEESINRTIFGQGKYKREAGGPSAFVLKEVKLENFLADQIVQRIRFSFSKDQGQEEIPRNTILVDGLFDNAHGKKFFRFSMISIKTEDPKKTILSIFRTINEVLKGYSFNGFDQVEIQDYLNRKKLTVDRQTFLDYQQKKITEDEILKKCLIESQSIQEAFKLFGFNPPQESAEKDSGVPGPATP